jgi:hypothetical protein
MILSRVAGSTAATLPPPGLEVCCDINRDEVSVDLGVDVTDVLGYTATAGLASIQNDDSSFVFATDSVRLDAPGGRLFLRSDIAVAGDNSALHRFS